MTNKKVRRQSLTKLNLTKPEKNSQWVFDQTKLVPSYNFRKCISTLKKESSLAKLPETLINACNNCFKEQLIVQYLNNTINVAYSSTFYIAHPNFQILHLSAQFIVYIVKSHNKACFGWMWPVKLLVQSDCSVFWSTMSLERINWDLSFFFYMELVIKWIYHLRLLFY